MLLCTSCVTKPILKCLKKYTNVSSPLSLSPASGNAPPPHGLTSWLTSTGLGRVQDETTAALPHDVYAIGTQENTLGEREWAEHLRGALRSITDIDFKLVSSVPHRGAVQCVKQSGQADLL